LQITAQEPNPTDVREFYELVKQSIAPFNIAGLCDETRQNMYPFIVPALDHRYSRRCPAAG
jgi:hypothetical protein